MKQKLEIEQTKTSIKFFFEFSPAFKPIKLNLLNNHSKLDCKILKDDSRYSCEVSYNSIFKIFTDKLNFKIDGIHTIKNKPIKKSIFLGNFKESKYTHFERITQTDRELYPYMTIKNNLAVSITKIVLGKPSKIKVNINVTIQDILCKVGSIILIGDIKTYSNKAKHISIILKGRKSRDVLEEKLPTTLIRDKYGNFHHTFNKEVFFSNFELKEDTYDLFFGFTLPGFTHKIERRIGNTPYRIRKQVKTLKIIHDYITFINPYFTFKGRNISFTVEKVHRDIYSYYEKLRHKKHYADVWLVGEQPFKAQDTGFHFFKYMRKNHPHKKVYYVIDFNSVEYANVKGLGNVIDYRSKEHFKILSQTTHLIASHHTYYLLPLTHPDFQNHIKAKKVFIQHGVFGTKNISNLYAKTAIDFDTDMFLVSSEKEKRFATDDLHFLDDEVKVTGLSRFDALFTKDMPIKRQILVIPTWRDWLQNYDAFIISEYYERYKSLLESKSLKALCKQNNLELVFCLHPNMQKFIDLFDLEGVTVISQGEVNVQHLLKESILMITDYSSVGFDFSFLEKPVIYYQFDTKRFLGKLPSHLDIDEDLPGDIVKNEKAILAKLKEYIDRNFKMTEENYRKSSIFLKYKDTNNNQRIKEEIEKFDVKKHPYDKFIKSEMYLMTYAKFRKSKYYFTIMQTLYKVMKLLPMKERVVFESGLGVQYADAPRYIFEELLKQHPNREYIWIHHSKIYNMPKNVKIIERLSWQYYYYLATSKYWVNNQNFPYYITKRKSGIYLQTWHGTPLKKMLFDIENIQGRDDDYTERVEQAKNQWSYLLSQSPYATEKFRSAFKYDGEILELGYSRNDILINHANDTNYISKIKNNLSLPEGKKIILYAPTFRDNAKKVGNKFTMPLKIDFDTYIAEVPSDHILLLRLHVLVKENIKIPEKYKERIMDVSDYADIQELYLVSDMLITDYSSVFFDYANLQKPILFYAYDLIEYRDKLRGFYMDYNEELPGSIIDTEKKLYHTINQINNYKVAYSEKYSLFRQKYLPKDDGKSTQRIIEHVFKF